MSNCKDVPCMVATFSIASYPIPKKDEAKLANVKFGDPEFLYLLATYCFDAQRKLLYACKAAMPILEKADPALRQQALEDSEAINAATTWKERAITAERIMLKLQRELTQELRRGEPGAPVAVG
jgi:hypothetical protein